MTFQRLGALAAVVLPVISPGENAAGYPQPIGCSSLRLETPPDGAHTQVGRGLGFPGTLAAIGQEYAF